MFIYELWRKSRTKRDMIVSIIRNVSLMKSQTFARAAGVIFLIIGLLHLARAVYGWSAVINGWHVPMELSWIVVLVAGYLAVQGLQLAKRS